MRTDSQPGLVTLAQVLGAGLLLLGVSYNEFLLAFLDPSPPIEASTVRGIRTAQLVFLVAGLVAIGGAVFVRRRERASAFVSRPLVENLGVFAALFVMPVVLLELAARPFFPSTALFEELEFQPLPPKPDSTYRVVTVGGSTVFGFPTPEFGFVAQLRASLREIDDTSSIEVVNYGKPGQSSAYVRKVVEGVINSATTDLLVVLTAHNEFLGILAGNQPEWVTASARAMSRFALFRLGVRVRYGPRHREVPGERLAILSSGDRGFRRAMQRFEDNLSAIVAVAGSRGVPLMLLTGPSNVRDWPPVHRGVAWASPNPNYDEDIEETSALVVSQPAEAVARIEQMIGEYGPDAMYSFMYARAAKEQSDMDTAREQYRTARDLDPRPWRALSTTNDFIRAFAGEDGVTLVDVESAFEDHAADRLVGLDLIGDNVHPTPLGNAVLAASVLDGMRDAGHVEGRVADLGTAAERLVRFLAPLERSGEASELMVQNAVLFGTYAMKTPYFHFSIARRHLREAVELSPDAWQAWAALGTLSLFEGNRDIAVEELTLGVLAKGAPLGALDAPYLAYAIQQAGLPFPFGR